MTWLKRYWVKLFFLILFLGSSYYFANLWSTPVITTNIFDVEKPTQRDIAQSISASGVLQIKDRVKVGCLANGIVKAIYVQENDLVAKGQPLAEIDNGRGDTEIREAQATHESNKAELEFQEVDYQRHRQLFEEHLISEFKLQEAKRAYQMTLANAKLSQVILEKKQQEYQCRNLLAPDSGIVIKVNLTKGEYVSTSSNPSFFEIAPDIAKIEADLAIEEKYIGQIQKGQTVHMVVETYPNKTFKSTITNVDFSPQEKEDQRTYHAKAYLDNQDLLLRPGMSINATIDVASKNSALSLTSRAFLIKFENLKKAADALSYTVQPLDKQFKQDLITQNPKKSFQFVWQVKDNAFKEIPIEIGITDDIYFEVLAGLDGDEQLVINVIEDNEMQEFYERLANRSL